MRNFLAFILIALAASCHDNSTGDHKTFVPQKKETPLKKEAPNPYVDKDISIMDMSYFPADYPSLKMQHLVSAPPMARVIYSRPIKQGRTIFGGLVPYGKQWRLGANEATEIEFFKTASIQDKKVNAGRYILYCIPQQTKWTLVLNNDIYTWGKEIDSTKDVMKFDVPVVKSNAVCEYLTMLFRDEGEKHAGLIVAWDSVVVTLPVTF